ncbi:hypothetical protein N665_2609s0002 [Sinapis alba]|nr:hypothetical protein N665_2609s0002 [Sinapis alba]
MSPSASTPELIPPPVPPDLLFLHPSSDLASSSHPSLFAAELELQPLVSPSVVQPISFSPAVISPAQENPSSSWVSKVKSSFLPLVKIASPTVSSDGIPSIQAPESISLTSSPFWKDHVVAYFHGLPPSAAKIFADLNPIWGKNGKISVKQHSKRSCLIYIPCPVTRQWVLDVGFWHSGNCSFTVALWYPSIDLSSMKLVYAPVWVLFKKVPLELWSSLGFSTMASAVGFPVHSEFPDIRPYSNGVVKLRVVVELAKPRPSSICIVDKMGNSVLLPIVFQKLPPKCVCCGEFGHLRFRCPSPSISGHGSQQKKDVIVGSAPVDFVDHPPVDNAPVPQGIGVPAVAPRGPSVAHSVAQSVAPSVPGFSKLSRSQSLPLDKGSESVLSSSNKWIYVASRSKPQHVRSTSMKQISSPIHISNAKFAEEEELIAAAQNILRCRLAAVDAKKPGVSSSRSRKHARKKIRQKLSMLDSSDSGSGSAPANGDNSSASIPKVVSSGFGKASGGQALTRSAHSSEA